MLAALAPDHGLAEYHRHAGHSDVWSAAPRAADDGAGAFAGPESTWFGGGHWLPSADADPRALALYRRHYSAHLAAEKARRGPRTSRAFVGPGEKMVLLTVDCSALFAWLRPKVGIRKDGQRGACCVVFRNEGPVRSSELVAEATELAWIRWPGERLFTYVHPGRIRSTNPGYCFLMAGWRKAGVSKRGLILLERVGG